jgi:hypothetical protein
MISRGARECFVYITLPGESQLTTAARFVLRRGYSLFRL